MESVKLMDRTDTKFSFRYNQLETILNEMQHSYKIVEIKSKRICSYETLYFDTASLKLYHDHHSGRLNRYKVRKRKYIDSGISFLEVKLKNNKGRTIKQRVKEKGTPSDFEITSKEFLIKELPFDPQILSPVVWVNYERVTLVNKNGPERVTIDINLNFIQGSKIFRYDQLVIAEVKQSKRSRSPFISCMKLHHIKEGSISKYCMAVAATHSTVKINNFKEKFNSLKKITSYDIIASHC